MKRFFWSILGAVALMGVCVGAAPAADFEAGHLIQVVYNEKAGEVGVDLTSLAGGPIPWAKTNILLAPPGTVRLSDFPNTPDWKRLRAGFFMVNQAGFDAWFAATTPEAPGIHANKLLNLINGFITGIQPSYQRGRLLRPGVVRAPSANPFSPGYDMKYNLNSAVPGAYGGYNGEPPRGEAALAPLNTGGHVDMYLYHYPMGALHKGSDSGTDYTAVLRIHANGSTVLNPVAGKSPRTVVAASREKGGSEREGVPSGKMGNGGRKDRFFNRFCFIATAIHDPHDWMWATGLLFTLAFVILAVLAWAFNQPGRRI